MRRLLRANLRRLWKSAWFWICMVVIAAYALFAVGCECFNLESYGKGLGTGAADSIVFDTLEMISFVMAVFVSMFVGTEYSNKTIRNKIIVGHSKMSVYLSNVVICSLGTLMMYLLHFAIFTIGGLALLGPFAFPKETLICFLCGLVGVVAKTSVFVLIAMLITSKSASIITILIAYGMLTSVVYELEYRVEQPETYEAQEYDWETGEVIGTQIVDNPYYIENEALRDICEFLIVFFPQGQDSGYMSIDFDGLPENIGMYPIYSFLFSGIVTGSGVLLFRKKDLK